MLNLKYTSGIYVLSILFFSSLCVYSQGDMTKIKKICIDAGHGGKDPGTIGVTGLKEKDVTLAVALYTGKLIKQMFPEMKIVYTRKKDVSVDLKKRGQLANAEKVDLFISIHANSASTSSVKGIETYVLGALKNEDNLQIAMKENSVIKYEEDYTTKYAGFEPNRAESYIIFSLIQNVHLDNSLKLGDAVHKELVKCGYSVNRGVKQAPFWVLKVTAMPSILVELGFMSNKTEERYLRSENGRRAMANAIAKGFAAYKAKIEGNSMLLERNVSDKKTDDTKNEGGEGINKKEKTIKFAIQIAASVYPIKDKREFKGLSDVKMIKTGRYYKYYVCEDIDFDRVEKKLPRIRQRVKDCFIIAVSDGNIVPVPENLKGIK